MSKLVVNKQNQSEGHPRSRIKTLFPQIYPSDEQFLELLGKHDAPKILQKVAECLIDTYFLGYYTNPDYLECFPHSERMNDDYLIADLDTKLNIIERNMITIKSLKRFGQLSSKNFWETFFCQNPGKFYPRSAHGFGCTTRVLIIAK